ncbi:M14 family metallopeptidase [Citrobacter portucalensis]|uniref:M14 family metallopeptidase n=1 Tax=Citrobacter portucalensis TaxID=1639133 RepID=UPI001C643826|nr:M14 family metallopeptidase [Citrobacter portucalensis]MBW7619536.1 M14 family metallopeptidase [Citrobacter portucalensis]MBW7638856.1 M14 family metallopeptidase [Citrobacter portucalensis]MCA2132976.1 M14 family metallopeptidase [Citrobacter portucalensis]MCA2143160.1 M14 family metallopeptidase [Citrobacter portucalensis]MCA2148256.1 M14 family metallopeptidase [Citrobacter portucalensis]
MAQNVRDLFSRNYAQARERFLQAAASRGLQVDSYVLGLPGEQGEELATDVVLDGPADAEKLLIIISGVHGVEGYSGSAIQTGMLGVNLSLPADTAVLYIHAVNPYGFSWSRRVTQENVDLNRNFVDFSDKLPVNANYEGIHDLLLPIEWPLPDDNEAKLQQIKQELGPREYQKAITLGQYDYPDGMYFGGKQETWSNQTIRTILRKYGQRCRYLGSLDVHTGLGPYGFGERIFACLDEGETLERARRWWGNVTSVHSGSSTSIPMSGPVQFALFEECSQSIQTNMCLEFGTYPLAMIIQALRGDHWLYRRGSSDKRLYRHIQQVLKDAFYPQEESWQNDIWQQGHDIFLQTLSGLQEVH